jgi:peptidoglycan/LPS O-acetylase OafA/YrhL
MLLTSPPLPKYVPHVDGLRAIAVSSVLLFHAGLNLPGGYLGVDVFFVISGFLITRLLRGELLATGRIEYMTFYLRRIRRLLPASFVVMAITAIGCLVLFAPHDLLKFSQSLVSAIFSASNILFFLESGYFDDSSELKPLLHTWSLSVEEQFYLLWPFLLAFVFRHGGDRRTLHLTLLILIASVAINLAASFERVGGWLGIDAQTFGEEVRSAMFFLLPFRAYELAIGALIVWLAEWRRPGPVALSVILIAGLAAIAGPLFLFTAETPIPSYHALIPCLGTACVIYAGDAPILKRLLDNPVCIGLGKISYSLYLVHWPLISLWAYWTLEAPTPLASFVLISLSIGLATLLYIAIERPSRVTEHLNYRVIAASKISRSIALGACVLVGLGIAILRSDGLTWRLPPERQKIYLTVKDPKRFDARYYGGKACKPKGPLNKCVVHAKAEQAIYLVGDSHARHYIAGLMKIMPETRIVFFDNRCRFNTLSMCYSRWGKSRSFSEGRTQQWAEISKDHYPVVIAQSWFSFDQASYADLSTGRIVQFNNVREYVEFLVSHLVDVKATLKDRTLIVLGEVNRFGKFGDPLTCIGSPFLRDRCQWQPARPAVEFNALMKQALAAKGIVFLSPTDATCLDGICQSLTNAGLPIYSDSGHLSVWGSEQVVQHIWPELSRALKRVSAQAATP